MKFRPGVKGAIAGALAVPVSSFLLATPLWLIYFLTLKPTQLLFGDRFIEASGGFIAIPGPTNWGFVVVTVLNAAIGVGVEFFWRWFSRPVGLKDALTPTKRAAWRGAKAILLLVVIAILAWAVFLSGVQR